METIYELIDDLFTQPLFNNYQQLYHQLLKNQEALDLIAAYKAVNTKYANKLMNYVSREEKDKLKTELLELKQQIDGHNEIKAFYQSAREVELFVENLNYDINQVLIPKSKTGCTCSTTTKK